MARQHASQAEVDNVSETGRNSESRRARSVFAELDVVDVEFTGAAKNRILCVYLEKNAEGEQLKTAETQKNCNSKQAAAENPASEEDAEEAEPPIIIRSDSAKGELDMQQLSWLTHEDCAAFSAILEPAGVEDLISRRRIHAGSQLARS